MKSNKCFFCNKIVPTPIHLTEINKDGTVESCNMCIQCGRIYMSNLEEPTEEPVTNALDLTHIKTPEELLDFLAGIKPVPSGIPACQCGMTEAEFDKYGRFGCPRCYTHFSAKMEELVFPFHKARQHVGKKPRRGYIEALMADPVERKKILKLRYAKALELENYEKAAEIKKELDDPSTS